MCEPGRQNQLPGAAPPDPCCKLAQIRPWPPPTAGEAGQLVSILHIMIITNRLLIIIFFGNFIRSRLPTPTLRSVLSGVLVDDINDRATDGHGEVLRNHGKMKEVQRSYSKRARGTSANKEFSLRWDQGCGVTLILLLVSTSPTWSVYSCSFVKSSYFILLFALPPLPLCSLLLFSFVSIINRQNKRKKFLPPPNHQREISRPQNRDLNSR